jgi:hypothetical protein
VLKTTAESLGFDLQVGGLQMSLSHTCKECIYVLDREKGVWERGDRESTLMSHHVATRDSTDGPFQRDSSGSSLSSKAGSCASPAA